LVKCYHNYSFNSNSKLITSKASPKFLDAVEEAASSRKDEAKKGDKVSSS